MTRKLNLKETYSQLDFFEESINDLYQTMSILKNEYDKLLNVNFILVNNNKALKKILISKGIFTEKDFEKSYFKEVKQLQSEYENHMKLQNEMQIDFLMNNVRPGNS